MAAVVRPNNFIIIPENLRGLGVGRIMPPNLLPQIVAAVMAGQPQPIPNPLVAQPIVNVAQPIVNVAQPNNDAVIAAILAAQPIAAIRPGPAIRPAIPLVNNDNALIAAIIAMQQTQPNADNDDDDNDNDEVVQLVKQYDENIDCIDVNDDNSNIGCVPK